MEKLERCDKCRQEFIRKYVAASSGWSKLNEVGYWTEEKGWNGYKLLCRRCLKNWRERHADDFLSLVSTEKKTRFRSYIYNGLLDREDLVSKQK